MWSPWADPAPRGAAWGSKKAKRSPGRSCRLLCRSQALWVYIQPGREGVLGIASTSQPGMLHQDSHLVVLNCVSPAHPGEWGNRESFLGWGFLELMDAWKMSSKIEVRKKCSLVGWGECLSSGTSVSSLCISFSFQWHCLPRCPHPLLHPNITKIFSKFGFKKASNTSNSYFGRIFI